MRKRFRPGWGHAHGIVFTKTIFTFDFVKTLAPTGPTTFSRIDRASEAFSHP